MSKSSLLITAATLIIVGVLGWVIFFQPAPNDSSLTQGSSPAQNGFDLSESVESSIPLDEIVRGAGRDSIPPIDDPKFVDPGQTELDKSGRGILVDLNGIQRFYPYAILDWHEIVNDNFGDTAVAVTYCPLCGSASVYDRSIDGEINRFGVSGLLHESNLLMYDSATESLWSQSIGEAVVGERTGHELERLPTQLITMQTAIDAHPNVEILSTDTGHTRNYGSTPYQGYEDREDTLFEVSVDDNRLPAKTIMYVVPLGDNSVAFEQLELKNGQSLQSEFFDQQLSVSKDDSGQIFVEVDGQPVNGYYEMWFSWATQHQDNGRLWQL